jgi:ATP-dependent Lon protease
VIPSPRANDKVVLSSGASIPAHRIEGNMMPVTTFLMPLADGVPLYEGARWVYELTPQDLDRKLFYMRTNHVVLAFMRRPDDTSSPGPLETNPASAPEISEVVQTEDTNKTEEKSEETETLKKASGDELVRVHRVGFFSRVKWSPDTTKITFWPQVRVEISNVRPLNSGMIAADIKALLEPEYSESDLRAVREGVDKIIGLVKSMIVLNPTWSLLESAKDFVVRATDEVTPEPIQCLSLACNLLANDTLNGIVDFQKLVAAVDARDRAKVVLDYFTVQERLFRKYFEVSKLAAVNRDEAKQREVYESLLQEAQQEWGGSADAERQKMIDKFKKRIAGMNVPREAMQTIEEQLGRLSYFEPAQSEYGLTVAYLDILTQLPWGVHTQDNFDIDHAKSTPPGFFLPGGHSVHVLAAFTKNAI